ncbi:MAG TPA: hypothetical protein VKG23_17460, partial [Thermoanaerobaculia bacterium]|nr:hypothetical protein [Thermoanaerobaculia bacterium]
SFQKKPDFRPFDAKPARVPTDARNASTAYGAEASAAMDFAEADEAPDQELNEIIWRSVRGADSPMPPAVRSAFVTPHPTPDR